MGNIIVALILIFIVGMAIRKIYIDKKNGVKCSGCPSSKECSSHSCKIEK